MKIKVLIDQGDDKEFTIKPKEEKNIFYPNVTNIFGRMPRKTALNAVTSISIEPQNHYNG